MVAAMAAESGWATGCGLEDTGYFSEVVWAEDAGGDGYERPGFGGVEVVKAMDDSARDADGVAWATSLRCPSTVMVRMPERP